MTAAILLVAAFVIVVLTAPISELSIRVQNIDDSETVHVVLYLDDTIETYSCAGPGLWISWKVHLVPGTHSIGIDYVFNQSVGNEPDQVIDFALTAYVGFNGVKDYWLTVNEERVAPHLADPLNQTPLPLEQAVNDPHVMVPAVALTALHVVLLVTWWNIQRTQKRDTPGKEP